MNKPGMVSIFPLPRRAILLSLAVTVCLLPGCGKRNPSKERAGGFSRGSDDPTGQPEAVPSSAKASDSPAPAASPPVASDDNAAATKAGGSGAPTVEPRVNVSQSSGSRENEVRPGSRGKSSKTAVPPKSRNLTATPRSASGSVAAVSSRLQLECDGSILIKPFVIKRSVIGGGGPAIWMLTSSSDESRIRHPAACLTVEIEGDEPDGVIGEIYRGRLFLQTSANSPILFTLDEHEVEVEFTVLNDEIAEGRILPGELRSSKEDRRINVEGSFTATVATSVQNSGDDE